MKCPICDSEDCTTEDDIVWFCSDCGEEFEVEDFESNEGMLDNLDDEQYNFLELSDNLEELDDDFDDEAPEDLNGYDDDYEDEFDDW